MTTVEKLQNTLEKEIILLDGAMGTYFNRLHPEEGEAEHANISHPEWIKEIHKKYILAGAKMIRTNTFAVNHMLFENDEIKKNLIAAIKNAKEAVEETQKDIFIAGSIGPIRLGGEMEEEQVLKEYKLICDILAEEGIRIFILETFSDTAMVIKIAEYLQRLSKEVIGEEFFILPQFSVNRMGYTMYGYSMQRLVNELEKETAISGIGFNCGIGVAHMNKLLGEVKFSKDCALSVLPNAGYEHVTYGRKIDVDKPAYYASAMEELVAKGANLVGGCCGTTPEYIEALSKVLEKVSKPYKKQILSVEDKETADFEKNPFIEKLNQGKRVYVVEIDSPFNKNAEKFLEAAYRLKENEVDLVTISDSPMARPRAEAFEMGIYIANKTGIRVMPHVCCRDRNLIALRSAILGGHINGIRDMLIITGDPVARDDRNIISSVFDMNSIRLMDYVKNMNQETFVEEPVYYGGALNYAGVNIDAIVTRMKKKMEAGCSYFLTQPVYSDENIERVRELKKRTGAKIILGIMPLVSYKNALFMKNEMPGIQVPEEIIQCYQPDMEREKAEDVAVRISVEIGKKAMDFADGFYLMTPFNRVSLVNRIINRLRETEKNCD